MHCALTGIWMRRVMSSGISSLQSAQSGVLLPSKTKSSPLQMPQTWVEAYLYVGVRMVGVQTCLLYKPMGWWAKFQPPSPSHVIVCC
jgi:hypothetical protein